MEDLDELNIDFDLPPCDELRSDPLPPVLASSPSSWPPQLIFDLALGVDDYETLLERYNLNQAQLDKLYSVPLFRREVAMMTRELREKNTIFKNKAKVQAEGYLEDMHLLMKDNETPSSTKLSIFQTLTKLGELEPKPEKPSLAGPAGMTPSRMIVEWVGGPQDHSPVSTQKTIELTH